MQQMVIVNGCPKSVLPDTAAETVVKPLQIQFDRDFLPAWGARATPVKVSFAPVSRIATLPGDAWIIFLNKHSTDPGALGWHDDQSGKIFSRVFVGDCMKFGLDWNVTLSHEALEMNLDPDVRRVYRLPDGRLTPLEACDAVEADVYSYMVEGHRMSDFVLPSYFSPNHRGPWDFRAALHGPCPALTPGGYIDLSSDNGLSWEQKNADKYNGLGSRRAILPGRRRAVRRNARAYIEIDFRDDDLNKETGLSSG